MPNAGEFVRAPDIPTVATAPATSSTPTLTFTNQDVPGATLTIAVAPGGGTLLVTGVFDWSCTAFTSSGVAIGECFLDGVVRTTQALLGILASSARATSSQTWVIPVTAGSRVIKLGTRLSAGVMTVSALTPHTTITCLLLNKGS